jgi:thiosulfate/3-mercaptopyruvate sulfurtransferase
MNYTTLIPPTDLAARLSDPDWVVVDCRFSLADTDRGQRDYLQAHIPGAVYAHLDEDLCGPIEPGETGRHPLPAVPDFVETLSGWGIDSSVQVVAYDDAGGALAAARLWWMLRWLGHTASAVLDGGWQAWQASNLPVQAGSEHRAARSFTPKLQPDLLASADEVEAIMNDPHFCLLDARTADRYRGENEIIDPVAGHIPGAISAPYPQNLDEDGRFQPARVLRARYRSLLGDTPPERTIFYCGSGVTAAHNILALAHAGLGEVRLYNGSWSEWITYPGHPVATGAPA